MTFNNYLNMEIGEVKKLVLSTQLSSWAIVDSDEGDKFMMYHTNGMMIVYTLPNFQKAGQLMFNEGAPTMQKGSLLAETADALFVQIYERIVAANEYVPPEPEPKEATTQSATAPAEMLPNEAYGYFIKYTTPTALKVIDLYRRVGNANEYLFVVDNATFKISHTENLGLNRIDVKYGEKDLAIISVGYFSPTELIATSFNGEHVSEQVARAIHQIVTNAETVVAGEEEA